MAASLRPAAACRLFTNIHRLAPSTSCLKQSLCQNQVPPDATQVKGPNSNENVQSEESPQQVQSVSSKPEEESEALKASVESRDDATNISEAAAPAAQSVASSHPKERDTKRPSQKKLFDLLSSLATADPIPVERSVALSHPKPRKRQPPGPPKETQQPPTEPELEPELVAATKEVAESIGGDVKATESELLSTLRLHSTETITKTSSNLSELFVGMKVERKKVEQEGPAAHLPESEAGHPSHPSGRDPPRPRRIQPRHKPSATHRTRVDLFGAEPLGIFKKPEVGGGAKPAASEPLLPTWERLQKHELQQSITHPPANAFVEMIQWTKEGKLWSFPINNEIGLEEEEKCGFHEHVFLERHLEGWCPQRGPIRHFMELVCTGLSKNPHLTVQRKQAHIAWYRDYFKQKEELLMELGAIEMPQDQDTKPANG